MKRTNAEKNNGGGKAKSQYKSTERTSAEEEPHVTQLNGLPSRAPPWPQTELKNENMFILPTRVKSRDSIAVSGQMQDGPKILTVGLITGYSSADYENVACQLEMSYPPNNEDKIIVKIIKDGYPQIINDNIPTSGYSEGPDFKVMFRMREEGYLDIYVGDMFLQQIELKHTPDEIRFLSVSGDVSKVTGLEFQFD